MDNENAVFHGNLPSGKSLSWPGISSSAEDKVLNLICTQTQRFSAHSNLISYQCLDD